jgi:hypothetical protein
MATALREINDAPSPENDLAPLRVEWPYAAPERYIFRELSMKLEGGLQFFYKNPVLSRDVPPGGLAKVIADILNPAPPAPALFAAAAAGVGAEETPLDLNIHGDPAFVFLRLDPTLNLRFDSDEAAVSLKDAGVADHYGGLRYVLEDGTVQPEPATGCKLVYFAAKPPVLADGEEYRHGFNFHLELVQVSPSATSPDSILPIIIDPDVGHPGGSTT